MADVFSANSMPVPATPVKAGLNVQTTELSPEYSPAPRYSKTIAPHDQLVEIQTKSKSDAGASVMPDPDHPVLPIGNVFVDIRNHLSCHSIFKTNVETLLQQYLIMQTELSKTRDNEARLERELRSETKEKDAYKHEARVLNRDLKETRADLSQTRAELISTEKKLHLSVVQLMETAERLEVVKKALREAVREKDELGRQLEVKANELQYCKTRIDELKDALDVANKAENDANDRNVRLTKLLYQIEDQKASVERKKDKAEARVRALVDELRGGSEHYEEIIAVLEKRISVLLEDLAEVTKQRDEAIDKVNKRDGEIVKLNTKIYDLGIQLGEMKDRRDKYLTLYLAYFDVAFNLSPSCPDQCRSRFDHLRNMNGPPSNEEQEQAQIYRDAHPEQPDVDNSITGKSGDSEEQEERAPKLKGTSEQENPGATTNGNTEEAKDVNTAE